MKRIRVIRGWKGLHESDRGAAVAFGSFDGVHRGHQRVIELAARAAADLDAPLGVITFDPHPRAYFYPEETAFRLMKPDQQARALERLGVDELYILPLDTELSDMPAHGFVKEVLKDGLRVRHVAVGYDATFGKGRSGNPGILRAYGEELGIGVSVAEAVGDGQEIFSSTAVREALRAGHPEVAARILSRPFAIEGVVQRGRQLGRQLGFPTANVDIGDYVAPRFGVYATRTRLSDGRQFDGVANIGLNPTVQGLRRPLLEVWMFGFDEDIYDRVIETDLIAFLRPEETFGSLDEMTQKVMADAAWARQVLGT